MQEDAAPGSDVLDGWQERLTVPWGPLLTQQEAQRGLAYYGSGSRLQELAAKLVAGKPIKVRAGSCGLHNSVSCCASSTVRRQDSQQCIAVPCRKAAVHTAASWQRPAHAVVHAGRLRTFPCSSSCVCLAWSSQA